MAASKSSTLSSLPASPADPPLTDWARKYGRFSATDSKSGLTPTEYVFARLGNQSTPDGVKYEEYQKCRLKGFTSRELGQLDCLPTRDLLPSTLPTFILPMFRFENWETAPAQDFIRDALFPLANGQGMWAASNPVVWSMLEPILSLATTMLTSVYVLPWFDAFLNGPRERIPLSRLEPKDRGRYDLHSFRPRPAIEFNKPTASPADRDRVFSILQHEFKYTFGFMKADENPEGYDGEKISSYAMTGTNSNYMRFDPTPNKMPRVFTWLAYSEFEYLLRDDLNSAEKMCIEWSVANIIAHEVMHAIEYLRSNLIGRYKRSESYFDLEALPEVGYSFEQAINLGSTSPFILNDKVANPPVSTPPLGYWLHRRYPTANDISSMSPFGVVLVNPSIALVDEVFPIPITFYEDIQQETFWSVAVRSFGHALLHYRTGKEGSRSTLSIRKDTGRANRNKRVRFSALDHTYPDLNNQFIAGVETLRLAITMTPQERRAMEFGRNLLITSRNEQIFWENSVLQEKQVKAAKDIMASAIGEVFSQERQHRVFLSLIICMIDAVSTHEVQIAAIQSLEAFNQVTYPDRRAALKGWNRGTRVFLNGLKRIRRESSVDITPLILNLEIARMVLYDPVDFSLQTSEESMEIQTIYLAREAYTAGNRVSCRSLCNSLLKANSCSIFARCGVAAIAFALDKDTYEGWDERKRDLINTNDMLEYCMAGAPAAWRPLWKSLKTELMDVAIGLPKPADPNALLPEANEPSA